MSCFIKSIEFDNFMVGLIVCQSEINNRGVFATSDFKKNEPITTLYGRLVTYKQLHSDSGMMEDAFYFQTNKKVPFYFRKFEAHYVQIGKNLYVEPIEYDFFINHSCEPNSGSKNCRERVRDFNYIPWKLQQRYIQLGIVPDYNVQLRM